MAAGEDLGADVERVDPPPRARSGMTGAAFLVYWLAAIVVGAVHIHAAAWPQGGAPLSSDLEPHVLLATGLQESWQFFERDLRADQLYVMRTDGGALHPIAPVANAEPANLFGIGRRARKEAVERNRLLSMVAKDAWTRCGEDVETCLPVDARVIEVTNLAPSPTYCGPLVLLRKTPVSWAYASAPHPPQTIYAVRVVVKC